MAYQSTTQLPTTDLRAPYRVRFSTLSSVWIREFFDPVEAARFAKSRRLNGGQARVEGGGLESRRVA